MSRLLRGSALFLCLVLILLALPVMAQVSQPDNADGRVPQSQTPGTSAQPLPVLSLQPCSRNSVARPERDSGPCRFCGPSRRAPDLSQWADHLKHQVVQVLYGSGSYNAQVAGTTSPTMGNFFADITQQWTDLPDAAVQHQLFRAAPARYSETARSPDCSRLFRRRATMAPPLQMLRSSQNFWRRSVRDTCPAPVLDAREIRTPFI